MLNKPNVEVILRRIWAIALSPDELYHESRKYIANIKKHATAAKKYRLNCLRITAVPSLVWVGSITSSSRSRFVGVNKM